MPEQSLELRHRADALRSSEFLDGFGISLDRFALFPVHGFSIACRYPPTHARRGLVGQDRWAFMGNNRPMPGRSRKTTPFWTGSGGRRAVQAYVGNPGDPERDFG